MQVRSRGSREDAAGGKLQRTFTEGVGILQPGGAFNVVRAAYKLFDPDDKGHISAEDLSRVCAQLGYPVNEHELENMLSVLAPSLGGQALQEQRSTETDR